MGLIKELTARVEKLNLSEEHDVQFFISLSQNKTDSEEAQASIRQVFEDFSARANEFIYQTEPGRPVIVPELSSFAVEVGPRKRHVHIHAILTLRGRGEKIYWDIVAVRAAFPNMWWSFKYVQQPRRPEETFQIMAAYATKTLDKVPELPIQHTAFDRLLDAEAVTVIGTTSDVNRQRRFHELAGHRGTMLCAELTDPTMVTILLNKFSLKQRKPRSTCTHIYIITMNCA